MGVMVKLASGQEGERLAQKSLDLSAQQLQVTKAASLPVQDHPTWHFDKAASSGHVAVGLLPWNSRAT